MMHAEDQDQDHEMGQLEEEIARFLEEADVDEEDLESPDLEAETEEDTDFPLDLESEFAAAETADVVRELVDSLQNAQGLISELRRSRDSEREDRRKRLEDQIADIENKQKLLKRELKTLRAELKKLT